MEAQPVSFEEFFHAERDKLFRVLCAITGSRQEAEDLAQEAFARIWERWDAVSTMVNPTGYLHRTALNLSAVASDGRSSPPSVCSTGRLSPTTSSSWMSVRSRCMR
jgi:DNA-directed RNA polymerase specialized sigma24 family protein